MSLKTSLLKAFGFSSVDDDDYDEMSDLPSALPVNQQPQRDVVVVSEPEHVESSDSHPEPEPVAPDSIDFPLTIFDSLLQVFNDAQPDFIKKCLDIEAQRRYLYSSIDASFKEYMAQYQDKACAVADRRHEYLLRKFDAEKAELNRQLEAARKSVDDAKEQSMSAVRQRRAFNERIRDLEQQLEEEKAEKDQFALETKSLLNKLKVAQLQAAPSDDTSTEELARLRQSLDDLQVRLNRAETEKQELQHSLAEKQAALETTLAELHQAKSQAQQSAVEATQSPAETTDAQPQTETQPPVEANSKSTQEPEPTVQPVVEPQVQRRQRKRRRNPKPPTASISAIDDSLDTTEWLVPTPPAGSAKPASSVSDAEFGYHEPPREEPPLNDAQLFLFD